MATTLEAIQAKMDKLKAQADALIAKQSSGVVEKIRELMTKHGITTADIDAYAGGKQRAKKVEAKTVGKKSAAAAKYRDPKSGATWTGHGRAPQWIASAKNRDRFLVDGAATTPVNASKAKAAVKTSLKAGSRRVGKGQPKGPQPALYADPKTGATWSGRGRAPEWIAGTKDRSKFLIDGARGVADSDAASKAKTVAKKPATKSAVANKAPAKKAAVAKNVAKKTNVGAAPEAATAQATG